MGRWHSNPDAFQNHKQAHEFQLPCGNRRSEHVSPTNTGWAVMHSEMYTPKHRSKRNKHFGAPVKELWEGECAQSQNIRGFLMYNSGLCQGHSLGRAEGSAVDPRLCFWAQILVSQEHSTYMPGQFTCLLKRNIALFSCHAQSLCLMVRVYWTPSMLRIVEPYSTVRLWHLFHAILLTF